MNKIPALIRDEIVPAGEPWMATVTAGQMLRIVDLEGNQAVDTLFYNTNDTEERYSAVLRPPRHTGRRLLGREQHRALCARQALHAQLPR